METFFKETEVRTFTQNDKIRFIFNQLITWLQPVETSCKKYPNEKYDRYGFDHPGYSIYFNDCNFENTKNIENPFPDISLKIDEKMIIFAGPNFKYQFAPDQILTIWNRMKKATK